MIDDIHTGVVGFNSHSRLILVQPSEEISDDPHIDLCHIVNYNSHNDEDLSFDGPMDDGYLLSTLEDSRRP